MRPALFSCFMVLAACTLLAGKAAGPPVHPDYRIGKAPKAEFKVAGKSFKIDPQARSAKQIRSFRLSITTSTSMPSTTRSRSWRC